MFCISVCFIVSSFLIKSIICLGFRVFVLRFKTTFRHKKSQTAGPFIIPEIDIHLSNVSGFYQLRIVF